MPARSRVKDEDGAGAAELEELVSAELEEVAAAQGGCKTEEGGGGATSGNQLAPLEEMFHLLRCRDVAQAR